MHKLFKRKNKIFQKETKQANDLNKIVLFIKKNQNRTLILNHGILNTIISKRDRSPFYI